MNKLLTGSLCLTDMIEKAKQQHSAFIKGNNGKIYINIVIWENEEKDKFDNTMSFQLNSKKELRETEGKHYIGNAKPAEIQTQPVSGNEIGLDYDGSNIAAKAEKAEAPAPIAEEPSDLPF